jgi:Restriction endonuclease
MAKAPKPTTTESASGGKKTVKKVAKGAVEKIPAKKPAVKSKPIASHKPSRSPKGKSDGVASSKPASVSANKDRQPQLDVELVEETKVQVVEMSDEERALSEVYGDELAAVGHAHAEFKDKRTKDEDRPMMPEMNARQERKKMWDDRRDTRHRRREERDRDRQSRRQARLGDAAGPRGPVMERTSERWGAGPGAETTSGLARASNDSQRSQPVMERTSARLAPESASNVRSDQPDRQRHDRPQRPVAPALALDPTAARIGTLAGDATASLFSTLPHTQPLPVKQLAQMLRKRNAIEADPETYWPTLKMELLQDERAYRSLGLRPRVSYRGRDLFAPGNAMSSVTSTIERSLADAMAQLQHATMAHLASRVSAASPAGFEKIVTAYLVATGYSDIEWVKRVDGISYATAVAPGIAKTILVSARSGDQPVDRRGVGELRVGVEAKQLITGVLFAAVPLSAEAERELEKAGRSVTVICGDTLIKALLQAGIGVLTMPAQIRYLDETLLDEILE